ncbi:MAG: Sec-independent protein translocase protein TatB [Proteobacteria bacterium]|nr:Sec-independent protein translocase protein TatB [Pseudomonadota bacterium]
MFNISPMELMLVFVVALLVIGPDKLPGAVRTGSLWLGRFRRSYNKVKSEIERELNTDEIKRQLHNEAVLEEIEQAKAHVKKIADETKVSVDSLVTSTTFDPGASSATESQLVNDLERNSIAPEKSTAPGMASTAQVQSSGDDDTQKENEETPSATASPRKKPSYGTGVNPKLAQTQESPTAREQAE